MALERKASRCCWSQRSVDARAWSVRSAATKLITTVTSCSGRRGFAAGRETASLVRARVLTCVSVN